MRVLIISASPRTPSQSHTVAIAQALQDGILQTGTICQICSLADKNQWTHAIELWSKAEQVLIAVPVYCGTVSGTMIQFLEELHCHHAKGHMSHSEKTLAFLVHSGLPEHTHRDCAVRYVESIPEQLGCVFGGTLCVEDTLRLGFQEQLWEDVLSKISALGKKYAEHSGTFFFPGADALSGPATVTEAEGKTYCRWVNRFSRHVSQAQGCKEPLGYQPFSPKQNP